MVIAQLWLTYEQVQQEGMQKGRGGEGEGKGEGEEEGRGGWGEGRNKQL